MKNIGCNTHCEISGVDYKAKDDKDALDKIKILDKMGDFDKAGFNRIKAEKPGFERKRNLRNFAKSSK
jgi:hypothetical protein